MFLFFFGDNSYKNKETFKIFSPQILEVYIILLVKTTLESMFYYTFSAINTMFVRCTALLYDTTSTRLTIFWGLPERWSLWKQPARRQEGTSSEEKSDGFHKKCSVELWTVLMFELLLCYHTAAWCM